MKNLQIPGNGSPIENIQFMESNADEILEGYEYSRELTDDEIESEKTEFADLMIQIEKLDEEKRAIIAEIKEKLTPLSKKAKIALGYIRRGRMEVTETVYLIKDEAEGMIGTYNSKGEILEQRKMRGTEKQRTIYTRDNVAYKDGTND